MPIAYFYKKYNKSTKNDKNSNRWNGFGEDVGIENAEYEEELHKKISRDEKQITWSIFLKLIKIYNEKEIDRKKE